MTLAPLWMQNDDYPAKLDRQLIDVLYSTAGLVGLTDWTVSQRAAGANRSVDVSAGRGIILGTDVTAQGKYLPWSDAVVNVPIAAAPGTGLTRFSKIVALIRDADAIGGSNNDWVFMEVAGTAATTGTQVLPATPASALWISTVTVGPNVTTILTANIDNSPRTYARLATPLRDNPGGKAYATSGTSIGLSLVPATLAGSADLTGGVTFSASNGSGLVVPVDGFYNVGGQFKIQPFATASQVICAVGKNVTDIVAGGAQSETATSQFLGATAAGMNVPLEAGDTVNLLYEVSGGAGASFQCDGPGQSCFVSLSLASLA